ncbi:Copper chaperone CopZ [Geoalkalibacter ferrihydriticus]|uniref:Copper chaperone CopZ n=1 Tax=Geoalkalibacter ferrihydriticus TaxID=392333 RepID=A0A1G9PRP6_9BACT|nr:cation transporter [Geoalkalibacter ferrihydriticus]SDM01488.1 Copper chaperone CopZ [Geoalkalibacter ferrihydriticus]
MKSRLLISVFMVLIAVVAAVAVLGQRSPKASAYAELKVANMTCGACIGRVQKAARDLPGVGSVEVNIAAKSARVAFDPQRVEGAQIAATVTAAGYPAQLISVVDAQQLQAAQQAQQKLAAKYVGQIGERLVPREEFDQHLARLAAGSPMGLQSPAMAGQVWQQLVQRELLLADAAASGLVASEDEARQELHTLRQAMTDFEQRATARFGSLEAFLERLKDDLTIRRHLEQNVTNGEQNPRLRQLLVEQRLQEIGARIPVKAFDPALKAGGGGCGGSCC